MPCQLFAHVDPQRPGAVFLGEGSARQAPDRRVRWEDILEQASSTVVLNQRRPWISRA
jgi:hypothetical protein